MDREALTYFKGKKIKIYLEGRIVYNGFIEEIFESSIIFIDKFNTKVAIPFSQIERIEVSEKDDKPESA